MAEELVEAQKDTILSHHEGDEVVDENGQIQANELGEHYQISNGLLDAPPNDSLVVPQDGQPLSVSGVLQQDIPTDFEQFDLGAYRWQQNGRKIFKVPDRDEIIRRQHWRCSNWDKPTKDKGCKAKYRIDIYGNGKPASEPIKSEAPHNHPPPPERGRVDMETQLQLAKSNRAITTTPTKEEGLPPAKRHCVDPNPATAVIPREEDQQTVAIRSVIALFESYGPHFTQRVDLVPNIRAIFASPKGLEDLRNSSSVRITSDYIAVGLTLVIFNIPRPKEEDPAVLWLVSNSQEFENYEAILRNVDELTGRSWKPESAEIGPDPGFREAFARVFPTCNCLVSPFSTTSATPLSPNQNLLPTPPPPAPNQNIISQPPILPSEISDNHQPPSPPQQFSSSTQSVIASTILSSLERPQII